MEFAGQRPANSGINPVDVPAIPQATRIVQSRQLSLPEVLGQSFEQPRAVPRPIPTVLLKLDDIAADQPITDHQGLINCKGGVPHQVLSGRINRFEELRVFHRRVRCPSGVGQISAHQRRLAVKKLPLLPIRVFRVLRG